MLRFAQKSPLAGAAPTSIHGLLQLWIPAFVFDTLRINYAHVYGESSFGRRLWTEAYGWTKAIAWAFCFNLTGCKDNQLQKRIDFCQGLEDTIPEKNRAENFISEARDDWQRQIMTIVGEPATFQTMGVSLITYFPFYRVRNDVRVPGSMRLDCSWNFNSRGKNSNLWRTLVCIRMSGWIIN